VFIHQELSLAEELTVAENIYLGELPRKRFGRSTGAALFDKTNAILQS
jgi:ribose transport system ATP-binding protein